MKQSLLDLLVTPTNHQPLTFEVSTGGEMIEGKLVDIDRSVEYPVRAAIPRFTEVEDKKQAQTRDTFAFKWQQRESYETPEVDAVYAAWMCQKYGFSSYEEQAAYFAGRQRILDLGCGSGNASLAWLRSPVWTGAAMWVGADISEAIDIAADRLGQFPNTHFVQADALQFPFANNTFDTILSEGVLHHTPSTRAGILSAARVLKPSGTFHFYVYRRKAPIREFTDDYVRDVLRELSDEAAWHEMRSLTQLGRALAELDVQVDVPEVPVLGIKAGRYDAQRLIYWNFAKLFWNPSLPFEANVHVNFDWYRPQYAHRQTEAEIRMWCTEANLTIERLHEEESGFTVRAVK